MRGQEKTQEPLNPGNQELSVVKALLSTSPLVRPLRISVGSIVSWDRIDKQGRQAVRHPCHWGEGPSL